jgi:hypothetical protein
MVTSAKAAVAKIENPKQIAAKFIFFIIISFALIISFSQLILHTEWR